MLEIKQQELTPLMKQYVAIREEYPDFILFFQVGDFYELFFDDAKTAASFLGIALTKRGKIGDEPIPLCGVPVHALDHYLTKLVKGGFKVALCDQLEEAQPGKVVNRGVTRVLTPGTLTDVQLLDEKNASYLFAFCPLQDTWGLVFGELLTAQLFATRLSPQAYKSLESELSRFFPDEILLDPSAQKDGFASYFKKMGYVTSIVTMPDAAFEETKLWMNQQFKTETIDTVAAQPSLHGALNILHAFLKKNQPLALDQFKSLHWYESDDFLVIDAATQRNLELVKNSHDGSSKHTLACVLDRAMTAMGSRMIKKWIMRPLVKQEAIGQRQDAIAYLTSHTAVMQQLRALLHALPDIERVVGRIAIGRAPLHDYNALEQSLKQIPLIKELLLQSSASLYHFLARCLEDFAVLQQLLDNALNKEMGASMIIKSGYDHRLDHMRTIIEKAHLTILDLERSEQEKTGIGSLKIRYNNLYGYYIEVTKTHLDSIPDYYKRQQTLVGRERYMIPALHEIQHEITSAQQQVVSVEKELYEAIKRQVLTHISSLRKMAHALSHLDALFGLSVAAYEYSYVRPTITDDRAIQITHGRHPVLERHLDRGFIANSTELSDAASMHIITGPNMGGKSTYLRQIALIAIMAHIGSFVPAQSATISILDRLFSRIGAGDNLAEGKSTFLIEMEEVAAICSYATERSLVILDEVGRGTSTFDGLAIAQAVVEYVHTKLNSRALFATHYHELAHLEEQFSGIVSYHMASKKTPQGIIFLHTVMCGAASGSFGIEVAKLAELPSSIIERAQELLDEMDDGVSMIAKSVRNEQGDAGNDELMALKKQCRDLQIKLQGAEQIIGPLQTIDYDTLSPKAAFDLLWNIKSKQHFQ